MKTVKKLSIILLCFFSIHAYATPQNTLITITSEAEPGKAAYLGVNVNAENRVNGIFYTNIKGESKNYSLDELMTATAVVKKMGCDLVSLQVGNRTSDSFGIALLYSRNLCSTSKEDMGFKYFLVRFNAHLQKYEIYDSNRFVSKANANLHRNKLGVPVGIDSFATQ